ncbi:MAG TPA: hypothetical protein VFH29_10200 [Anaerolineales bacterium]|nr:hypothetical protein [Anaerolineales bacterium]
MSSGVLVAMAGIPVVIWLASYVLLSREVGRWNLSGMKIHENGKYTLIQTVFYYSHVLRELPHDTLMALAILWSYASIGIRLPTVFPDRHIAWLALGLFVLWIVVGSLVAVGWRFSARDFLQYNETDVRFGWGTHWQMHFLSTAALILLLLLPGLLLHQAAVQYVPAVALILIFLGLSWIFRTGADSFTRTRWVLHGARELLTYGSLVALPAFLPLLAPAYLSRFRLTLAGGLALLLLMAAVAHDLRVYQRSNLDEEASSPRGPAYLISSHFFEHVLDFVYIALVVLIAGS